MGKTNGQRFSHWSKNATFNPLKYRLIQNVTVMDMKKPITMANIMAAEVNIAFFHAQDLAIITH
jgi:hypothetical protein